MAHFLMVIAAKDFRDEEYFDTKEELIKAGHQVTTASTALHATGSRGGETNADILLTDCKSDNFDAIAFIGGPGSYNYFEDPVALGLAKAFAQDGKITSAICAAPGILAHAGLLKGRNFTSFEGVIELVENVGGGKYQEFPVVKDGNIITSQGPLTAHDFGRELAKAV